MLVSELLKKTNQSMVDDSKVKEETPDITSLMKRFTDLSIQAQMNEKSRNAKIEHQLLKIDKDLQNFGSEDETDKIDKQIESLKSIATELINEDDKIDTIVKERSKCSFENFQTHIDDLRQESKEVISGFNRESDKHLFTIDITLKKQQKAFLENLSNYNSQLNEAADILKRDLEINYEERQSKTKEVKGEVFGCLETLEEDLSFERNVREQTEDKLRELIMKMNVDLEAKVVNERKKREACDNMLLDLLEQACIKIEKRYIGY